jgi:hypothetical protein
MNSPVWPDQTFQSTLIMMIMVVSNIHTFSQVYSNTILIESLSYIFQQALQYFGHQKPYSHTTKVKRHAFI